MSLKQQANNLHCVAKDCLGGGADAINEVHTNTILICRSQTLGIISAKADSRQNIHYKSANIYYKL